MRPDLGSSNPQDLGERTQRWFWI